MDVVVYLPSTHAHFGTFDEVAATVRYGLKELAATGYALPDRTILLGAHLLPWTVQADARHILYNFEQLDSPLLSASALDMYRRHEVWDYSASNIVWLAGHGIGARHVPLGFTPELQRIQKAPTQDIDVLFYGLVNDRRRRVLDGLRAAGLVVQEVVGVYGAMRDHLIARSKVVLNMHFYDAKVFEMVRCSYLFANEVCVVSEDSVDVPPELTHAVPLTPYSQLVDVCTRLARDPDQNTLWAASAHQAFRMLDEVAILRKALDGPRP